MLEFTGGFLARLFSKELNDSLDGALKHNFCKGVPGFPDGFLRASKSGNVWDDTCWTRDAGSFLRECAYFGRTKEAALSAAYLIDNVAKNEEGYHLFPEFLQPEKKRKIPSSFHLSTVSGQGPNRLIKGVLSISFPSTQLIILSRSFYSSLISL